MPAQWAELDPAEAAARVKVGIETDRGPWVASLVAAGYEVFAINPNADRVEGDTCYPDLASVPGGVDAVVIGTSPAHADETMRECAELGISRVWMHRGPAPGSVSPSATAFGREHGITVIDGGCPCMFGPTADAGHRMMRPLLTLGHRVPRHV